MNTATDAALPFDVDPMERYLVAQIDGSLGPLKFKRFKGGQPNLTYVLTTPFWTTHGRRSSTPYAGR